MSRAKGHWGKTQHEDAEPWTLSWLLFSLLWQKRKAVCLEGLLSSARDVMAAGLRQSVSVHARSGKRVVRDGAQCPSPSQSGTPACGKIPSVYQVSLPSWKLLWEHTSDTPTGILTRGTMRLSITEVTTWRGGAREVGFTQSPVRTIPVRGATWTSPQHGGDVVNTGHLFCLFLYFVLQLVPLNCWSQKKWIQEAWTVQGFPNYYF